jgi:hypothetical protein
MKKVIIFLLFSILFASCGSYEYYPDKIIRYRGKCLRMRPHPLFGGSNGKIKKNRIKRKKNNYNGSNPYKFWERQKRNY